MKQTLFYTLSFFAIATFMNACGGQMADKMAVVGEPALSSDPCATIDEKVLRLDRFTEVVQNTSAFHLEEKAAALQVPGITVSNNKKQMLRDAEKKQAEYAAQRQKYGCESTAQMADKKAVASKPALSSDSCDAIDKKLMKLDAFTTMVNHTSAFHLEEKATALPVPGITVSNNKKQMLRDAKKKEGELLQERQKQGCETPSPTGTEKRQDKKRVVNTPALVSEPSSDTDKKMMRPDTLKTKVHSTVTVPVEAKSAALPVPGITANHSKEPMVSDAKKKQAETEVERQKFADELPVPDGTVHMNDQKEVAKRSTVSSDTCDAINKKLIELYEFTIMVKNTSSFHLQEKAAALSVPGITVSNNKKKMLQDAEKKGVELLAEREKQGCGTSTK
jgi:hypothetical protein